MKAKNLSRIIGFIWICTSVLWATLGITGIFYVSTKMSTAETVIDEQLNLVIDTLKTTEEIVVHASEVVSSTQQSLTSVQKSVHDASVGLSDLRPLLWETTKVVTLDVPVALDGVQNSMPSLIETANSIDDTLTWLSVLEITIPNPFGNNWNYDLGISYDPEIPFNESLEELSSNLEGIPDDMRNLDDSLSTADENLLLISDDLAYLAGDIDLMKSQIQEFNPRIESLAGNMEDARLRFHNVQDKLPEFFETTQKLLIALFALIFFTQIPSLYFGWLLINGNIFLEKNDLNSTTETDIEGQE